MTTQNIENINVTAFDNMPSPEEIHARLPISDKAKKTITHGRTLLRNILDRKDHRVFVVVGAGIVGLAHAWAAARRGLRVTVVERDHRCVGASIRNFGFVTVTGQPAGDTWRRARASRELWAELAPQAGITIEHRGLWLLARRPRAAAVLQAFMDTEMAAGNVLYDAHEAAALAPMLRTEGATAAMYSPHELRVESRTALPRLAAWLAERHGVRFLFGEAVLEVQSPRVRTARRELFAERVGLCPGTELNGAGALALAKHGLQLTRLQMLRVRPEPGFVLGASLTRPRGPSAAATSRAGARR